MFNIFQVSAEAFKALGTKMKILVVTGICLVLWSVITLSSSNIFDVQLLDSTFSNYGIGPKVYDIPKEKLFGGLLTAEFDEKTCVSRYQLASLYREPSRFPASKYLISKLRKYEKLHRRCGPGTKAYHEAINKLGHTHVKNSYDGECKYIVWRAVYGLGNRMLTLVSAFLYGLLTDRVVLVDPRKDMSDLFCEPFSGTSWLLPLDFPLINKMDWFDQGYSFCYGKMVRDQVINPNVTVDSVPPHVYLHIIHNSNPFDHEFFCQPDQTNFISKVPWLILQANVYFVPSLWMTPSLQVELVKLFPRKESVFYLLSRYLFHPTNQVWDMITGYYNDNLAKADERLGIQVRDFSRDAGFYPGVMKQIVTCARNAKLLPQSPEVSEVSEVSKVSKVSKVSESPAPSPQVSTNTSERLGPKRKVILVTSLYPEYSENLKKMYQDTLNSTKEIIEVYQPSGERFQQTDKKIHDQKALSEMYLLSLTDKIMTSARSTFGYVAYSIGGLRPWILYQPGWDHGTPEPPCVLAKSIEPCFLTPPQQGCGVNDHTSPVKIVPFVRFCEDRANDGIKVFDDPADEL